jgi:hypothetical protein
VQDHEFRPGVARPMCAAAGTKTGDPDAAKPALRMPVMWGLVVGAIQAASPLAFWWLDAATVYALGLVLIASIYIGFAVADGRPTVIGVEHGPGTTRSHRADPPIR